MSACLWCYCIKKVIERQEKYESDEEKNLYCPACNGTGENGKISVLHKK
jgi:hypothetical protein